MIINGWIKKIDELEKENAELGKKCEGSCKIVGKIPINPNRFDQIVKGIGRRKLGKIKIKVNGGL